MANADISLLFGVLGEGSLSGESGGLIQSQLTQIMAALNKSPLKVKVVLDADTGGKKSWSSQLQSKLDTVSSNGKFSVQISKLTLGTGAITDFRNQLNAVINTLHLDKGTSITLTADGIGEIKSEMKQVGDAASDAARKVAEFKVQMDALNKQKVFVQRTLSSLNASATTDDERTKVAELTAQYEQWAIKIEQIRAAKTAATGNYRAEIEAEGAAITANIDKLNEKRAASEHAAAAAAATAGERAAAEEAATSATERGATAGKDAAAAQKDLDAARKQGLTLLTQMQKAERDWNMAKVGKSSAEYGQIQDSIRYMQIYLAQLRNGEIDVTTFRQHLTGLGASFASSSNAIKSAGENVRTFGERIGGLAKKFGTWFSITRVIMTAIQTIHRMVANTREIEASLTQLRIVTGATDAEMEEFLVHSTKLAKELGQSITNVLGSIETFSRLGYNLVDSSTLAEFASILANVAAVDTDAATTGVTAIIKGFNMDVAESEHVADVLVEVGQKYAVSAGEMMEAYEKSGAALNAANTSFEKSAGLIAAANASVQNASTVGTALKTISARIRGATSDLEALGEDTDGLAQGFSKYSKEIEALTGFDIMVDGTTDTYKDIYDIFDGISKAWGDLTDTQQSRIAEILGGTRQLQVVSSILGNWSDAAGAYTAAMTSAGTATEANATYMDSINGKVGIFNATFQEFSNNLLSSGLVKFFVELGISIISALNALEELHLLLPMVAAVVVTIKALRAGLTAMRGATAAIETASVTGTIVAGLVAEKKATDALIVAVANLTIAEKGKLVAQLQAAVTSGALSAAEAKQILTTLGLAAADGTLTVANTTLATSFKALMASIPVWGWIALGITALITAVTALTSSFKSSEEKLAELDTELDELNTKISTTESEFRNLKSSSDGVIQRFSELSKGVNQFGENISLTDEEYAEFLSLNNRVAEMFPELNLGMDSNGNAMLALSYSADTLTDSLYALVEAERQAANQKIADTMPEVIENITSARKEYEKEIDKAKDVSDEWDKIYGDIVNNSLPTDVGRYSTQEAGYEAALKFIEKAQRLGMNGNVMMDNQQTTNNGYVFSVEWDYDSTNLEQVKGLYDTIIAGQKTVEHNYDELIGSRWKELNSVVSYWTDTNFLFNDLNLQMQDIAKAMISGVDFSALGLETAEDVQAYIEESILRPLFLAEPEVKDAFSKITDWRDSLKSGAITADEFKSNVESVFDDLINSMDADSITRFKELFISGFNAMGIEGESFEGVIDGIISAWSGLASVEPAGTVGNLVELITNLKSAYELAETARKEMTSGAGLSAETIKSLADAEENYLDYLYEENGVIKLNTEAWEENANAKLKGDMATIQAEIDALEERNAALKESVENYEAQNQLGHDGGAWAQLISEATTEIEENNKAILNNQNLLAIYGSLYGNITGDLNAYTAALNNFSNIANTIDTVSSSFQTLADLQAQVATGFTMSLEKALEFASAYPEILNNAQVSSDGQIMLNEGVVNTFIQGKKAELDAQIDAEIAKLEADKAVLEAKMQASQAQLDLAKNVGEGEGQISKELAEYRINAGNAVAQALIDAGIDEATAFKLAAAAMAQNVEEFDRIAMEVCTDVNGNFNQAAYDLAQTMYKNLANVKTDLASVAKQAHETAKAIAGVEDGRIAGSSSIQGGSSGGTGSSGIKLNLTSGSFEGTEYTYKAKESNLEDFISKIELDVSAYEGAIAQINGQISTLQALKNLPLKSFKSDAKNNTGSNSSKDDVKEYLADIDAYYAALKKLESIQLHRADIETRIENSDDNEEKIALTEELIDVYHQEAAALKNLNNLRSNTIKSGIKELEALGFQIEYNAETNEFFVKNLEHLNKLQADSVGEYESLQEATNALRENTEGLIDSLDGLNVANQDGIDGVRGLVESVEDANISIVEYLQEIVDKANEVVDGFQSVYTTLTDAAKEYAQNGFLSVDSLQAILELAPKYMAFLYDENGQLILNEQSLQKVIAAKTEEMAAETALSYAKQVLLAAEQAETDKLIALTQANSTASGATWNMAYATIGLAKAIGITSGMDASYFDDAVSHIKKMQSLSKTAVNSISSYYKTLDEGYISQKDALDNILELTKDMIRHENEEMIDALESQKDAFADIVALRKEALEAAKKEGDYDDEVEEKFRKIAKLQERINTLSLDDSRDAQSEKIKLEEEMYELQKELADLQADHALDSKIGALDKIQTAFEDQNDDEIAALEDTLNSEEKLYRAAIDRINQGWDTLYKDLLSWNYEYGSTLETELVSAWDAASGAVQRYGSFVEAIKGTQDHTNLGGNASGIVSQMQQNSIDYWSATDSERAQLNANQLALAEQYRNATGDNIERVDGSWYHDDGSSLYSLNQSDVINSIVSRMKANGAAYSDASPNRKKELSGESLTLGSRLGSYLGKNVYRDGNGEWWIDGQKLFEVYHGGGVAGGDATLKQGEVMAILKKGEPVLDEKREESLYRIIDFTTALSEKLGKAINSVPMSGSLVTAKSGLPELHDAALESITNNQNEAVHFGNVYIYGANEETVERHREVNRQFANEVLRQLNIKK